MKKQRKTEHPVYVDSRETQKRKKKAENIWGEENIRIVQLPVGDYVYKDVGIEFKTVDDFIGSIKTGRLYNQATRLNETFSKHYVIVYGDVGYTLRRLKRIKHSFSTKSYLGAIASISQITQVLHVDNESQAFTLADALFKKSTDGKNRTLIKPTTRNTNKLITILSILGGMNSTRAEKLLKELNIRTLKELTELTEEDIKKVHGFGDKTAKQIVEYLS